MKGLTENTWFMLALGIVIGAVGFLIFGLASSSVNLGEMGTDAIIFMNSDVHLDASEDFAAGTVPVYDESYCKSRFELKYEGSASSCLVKSVKTFARTNPLVKEVECSCLE